MTSGDCPHDSELAAFMERAIADDARTAIAAHLDGCTACRETVAAVIATADEPRPIGRYRLDRVIGRGGMGIVWQAWDPALERNVAIKVLRGDVSDEHSTARMVREARALAKLQHPNVIAVHDVGELEDTLFIATELVDGEALDRWQRGRAPAEILGAYAQAARGLAAAHELGLVHRDVKPSNILVGRDGRVRIGDFGLATRGAASEAASTPASAADGDAKLTVAGAVVGTPAYMAPEQRAGRSVDARADQYSLCLALAEALTGTRPAAGTTAAELAHGGVAAPWSAIARGLAADPADRHADLAPLIDALDGARPRSRARLVAAAAGLVALAGAGIAWQLTREAPIAACAVRDPLAGAWGPAARDAIRASFAVRPLAYAGDAATATIRALDAWAAELVAEDRRACEDTAAGKQTAEVGAQRARCLAGELDQLRVLVATLAGTPDAGTIQRAAASARALPRPTACATPAGLAAHIVPPDPYTAARVAAIATRVNVARTLRRLDKKPRARAIAEQALAEARSVGSLFAIEDAAHELGTILHGMDDPGAEPMLQEALATAARAHDDDRAARVAALLVEVVGDKGDLAAAERQATLARAAIVRAGGDRYLDGVVERGLGATAQSAKKFADAAAHYKRAEEHHAALGLADDVAFDRRAQVTCLGAIDRLDEARALNTLVLASDLANLGPKHPRTIQDMTSAALLDLRGGHLAEGAELLARVLPIDEEVSGKDSAHAATIRARLATAYQMLGRIDDAAPLYRDALRVLAATKPPADPELRGQQMNLAGIEILLGNYAAAEAELARLATLARAEKDGEQLGLILQNLAEAQLRARKLDAALANAREAIEVYRGVYGEVSRFGAQAHNTLGNIHRARGAARDAETELARTVADLETVIGKDTPELGDALIGLGELRLAAGRRAEARVLLERAVAVLARGAPAELARAKAALGRATPAR